jgi:phosphoribosylpyrophosphate synthetase
MSANMTGNFKGPQRPSPQFTHYDCVTLLGPPSMRGAIVFAGSSHPRLVEGICDRLGTKQGSATLGKFKNGETSVTIRTFAVFMLQTTSNTQQTRQSVTKMSSSSRAEARGW